MKTQGAVKSMDEQVRFVHESCLRTAKRNLEQWKDNPRMVEIWESAIKKLESLNKSNSTLVG